MRMPVCARAARARLLHACVCNQRVLGFHCSSVSHPRLVFEFAATSLVGLQPCVLLYSLFTHVSTRCCVVSLPSLVCVLLRLHKAFARCASSQCCRQMFASCGAHTRATDAVRFVLARLCHQLAAAAWHYQLATSSISFVRFNALGSQLGTAAVCVLFAPLH